MKKKKSSRESLNFSFSGLKSNIIRKVREMEYENMHQGKELDNFVSKNKKNKTILSPEVTSDIAAAFQKVAIRHVIDKTEMAINWCNENDIKLNDLVVCGGLFNI
jgi:tRNA A37 threonylcarbamoyltransferase TsaD